MKTTQTPLQVAEEIGQVHNEILELGFRNIEALFQGPKSANLLIGDVMDGLKQAIFGYIDQHFPEDRETLKPIVEEIFRIFPVSGRANDQLDRPGIEFMNEMVESGNFSEVQKRAFKQISDALEPSRSHQNLAREMQALENQVEKELKDPQDALPILSAAKVARHSLDYWDRSADRWVNLLNPDKNDGRAAALVEPILEVVAWDVAGGIGGAIFGPPGIKVGAASTSTVYMLYRIVRVVGGWIVLP